MRHEMNFFTGLSYCSLILLVIRIVYLQKQQKQITWNQVNVIILLYSSKFDYRVCFSTIFFVRCLNNVLFSLFWRTAIKETALRLPYSVRIILNVASFNAKKSSFMLRIPSHLCKQVLSRFCIFFWHRSHHECVTLMLRVSGFPL